MRAKFLGTAAATAALALLAAGCSGGAAGSSDSFPTGPIEYTVPLPAGGGVDAISRMVSPHLEEELGQNVRVMVRDGGAGAVGVQHVLSQAADGHNLLAVAGDTVTTGPVGNPEVPFDPEELTSVALITNNPYIVYSSESSPVQTPEELRDLMNDDPGDLRVGISTIMGSDHYGIMLIQKSVGYPDLRYVAYGGGGPKRLALAAGEIDIALDTSAAGAEYSQLTPLAVLSEERIDAYPDVPTAAELGFEDALAGLWIGAMVPADTPADVIATLESAFEAATQDSDFVGQVESLGLAVGFLGSEAMDEMVALERSQATELVDEIDEAGVEEGTVDD